ncbi:hypothetical protein Vadar_016717 [Vaccinium darrowii]|uniref:Uncharacterized protein n=1 Tax=Vaccinium darrowii TaxID=229202 RepID=A0ACB7Y8F9_9ERIC|nr:hypothetical protein Vadar_016717 [Vaccinium darrowii]
MKSSGSLSVTSLKQYGVTKQISTAGPIEADLQRTVELEKTRSPSRAAGMFSGTQEKCATCEKMAYRLEKVGFDP